MRVRTPVAAAAVALLGAAAASHAHTADPDGHTTVEQTIERGSLLDPAKPGFFTLVAGAGRPYLVREIGPSKAQPGRGERRRSLAFFGQLTDFQLADEESPARVEFLDPGPSGAWRPQEALHAFAIDQSLRQLSNFADASPVPQGGGARARMSFAVLTGDQGDNQQRNETLWVRQLVEGGQTLSPNSGVRVNDYAECGAAGQQALLAKSIPPEPTYVGVQDYTDYFVSDTYYDPNQPAGQWQSWPRYQGLMDRAQLPFTPAGLRVPSYVANGNHDGLLQGNEDANEEFERIATGCVKTFSTTSSAPFGPPEAPNPNALLSPGLSGFVPPDDAGRRFVDRVELKQIYAAGTQRDDHGFAFVDPAENEASGFAATYYAWDPLPGMRFISIDTVSEGGVVAASAEGNIDDPQWKWLEGELKRASEADKLIVLVGHHPIRSLVAAVPDEAAPPCSGRYDASGKYGGQADSHGHDRNPGCDLDTRRSEPLHLGADLVELLHKHPHVIAYVAGHTHENKVLPFTRSGGGWWEINTSAIADWPQQNRLIEVMDNRDGTLSIFGTVLDHSSPLAIPAPSADPAAVGAFGTADLAALGRSFSYNDPQASEADPPNRPVGAEGKPEDRNVELLLPDPRRSGAGGARGRDRASRKARIRLSVRPRTTRAGRRTRFRFRATTGRGGKRRAVRGATIRFGGRRMRTDRRGRARMVRRFTRRGRYGARATKRGLRPGRTSVRVIRRR